MFNMTYEERNALGFEGDTIAADKFKSIIEENKIHTVIETGTFYGATTKRFADWTKKVHTIEVNETNFNKAKEVLKDCTNVQMHIGSSEKVLDKILLDYNHKSKAKNNVLFFLDAHWQEYNPLLDELKAIAFFKLKPVIAIHDFKVPNNSELGFDVYKNITYEWDWIEKSIEKIYGVDGYTIEYNSEATGAKRGIIYIYPKK